MAIDLNADVGEAQGDDAALLGLVTSANVACGFHAGDALTMRETLRAAKAAGVAVGAHPGYADRAGFGRVARRLPPEQVFAEVLYQVGALQALCRAEGVPLVHVKPHGALYNVAVKDRELSLGIAEGVREAGGDLILVGLPDSELVRAGKEVGVRVAREAFGDRAYNEDGTLVSRRLPGSLITDPDAVAERVLGLMRGTIRAITGASIRLEADTVCLHGDTPGAGIIARRVREQLEAAGIRPSPMGEFVR